MRKVDWRDIPGLWIPIKSDGPKSDMFHWWARFDQNVAISLDLEQGVYRVHYSERQASEAEGRLRMYLDAKRDPVFFETFDDAKAVGETLDEVVIG